METVTSDLSKFGFREKEMAAELLTAYCKDCTDFLGDKVSVFMNMNSGYVFLSDEDFNVGVLEDDKIVQFFSCPECGAEGTLSDEVGFSEDSHLCEGCQLHEQEA